MMLPTKLEIAEALLERGSVFVHLDPRREGVSIPPGLRNQPQVVLQVGLDMPIPIPDLAVDADGVVATLSFNRTPYRCFVPWDAVFALVGDDGRGRVFLDSMPPEIRREVDREASATSVDDDASEYEDDDSEAAVDDAADAADASSGDAPVSDGRPSADVIPMWPRSVTGRGARPNAGRSNSVPPAKDPTPTKPTPDRPRPRPPHPHLRRIK